MLRVIRNRAIHKSKTSDGESLPNHLLASHGGVREVDYLSLGAKFNSLRRRGR
jgi:hypothetical protein